MCPTHMSFGRSKLLQSCSNFTLKHELEPTVIACLAGRDAQEVFILDLSKHRAAIQAIPILARHLECRYSHGTRAPFPQKHLPS